MSTSMTGKSLMKQHYLKKKTFCYSKLNMEDIIDADYMHAKSVCKDFEIKIFGEYHDLYLKRDTLLLADTFENFREVLKNLLCRSCKISFSSWISIISSFKKDWSKIRFNWYGYDINGWKKKKTWEEEYITQLIDMQKLMIDIWKIMIKN